MHLGGLDLNLLIVLDALFTERNVTRAGERVHLSQSATSAALARLRQFFDDELLVPAGNRMMLTSHAIEMQEQVRDIVLRADAITTNKVAFTPSTASRHFRLMMSDYPATVLMPAALKQIQEAAPGLTFQILSLPRATAEHLDRGDVDLLIMPQQFTSKRHPAEDLFEDGYVCVVWSESQIVEGRLSIEQYLDAGHVGVRFPGQPLPVMEEWFYEQLGRRRRVEIVATTFNLMAHLVVGTNRVATMHSWLARECARALPIRLIKPPIRVPRITECIQWHQYRETDPGIVWLRKMLKSAVPQEHA